MEEFIIGPFAQLLTMDGLPPKGPIKDHELEVLTGAGILIKDGKIKKIGQFEDLVIENPGGFVHEITMPSVAMPGLIDSHTHILFGGSRAKDYAMRNAGSSYQEIAAAGGGIWDTVQHTREQGELLMNLAMISRAVRHRDSGVTTIEVKTGYGLSVEQEIKMLKSISAANEMFSGDLISTCLAAHIKPKDYDGSHSDYLREMMEKLLPEIQREGLSNRIDAFVEEGAFSAEIIHPYFARAKEMGFDITVHADQFSPGGSAVAAAFQAKSADHLEASGTKEIELLSKSEVVATALPGASIGLGCNFTPARRLLDAGCCLAIASDWNPGSAPMGNLIMQAAVLGTFEKLTNAEVLAAITVRAAKALDLNDRAVLGVGKLADFCIFPTDDYREILYHQGMMQPYSVWKNGSYCVPDNVGFHDPEEEDSDEEGIDLDDLLALDF